MECCEEAVHRKSKEHDAVVLELDKLEEEGVAQQERREHTTKRVNLSLLFAAFVKHHENCEAARAAHEDDVDERNAV